MFFVACLLFWLVNVTCGMLIYETLLKLGWRKVIALVHAYREDRMIAFAFLAPALFLFPALAVVLFRPSFVKRKYDPLLLSFGVIGCFFLFATWAGYVFLLSGILTETTFGPTYFLIGLGGTFDGIFNYPPGIFILSILGGIAAVASTDTGFVYGVYERRFPKFLFVPLIVFVALALFLHALNGDMSLGLRDLLNHPPPILK